jgi:TPR repeat protein
MLSARALLLALSCLGALLLGVMPAAAEKRVALIIGNAAYQHYGALANPAADVKAVGPILRAADFDVVEAIDLPREELERAIRGYLGRLDGADVSLVYYSGHAVQVDGRNFIIPIDAKLESELDLDFEALDLDTIMKFMQARSSVRLVFLDACRNNPFAGRAFSTAGQQTRSVSTRGLARIDAGVGTLIAFSTEPGNVALDGEQGGLSPFTSAFVKHALTPAIDIRQMLTAVRNDVVATTQGKQVPWENSSLVADFFFVPKRPPPVVDEMHQVAAAPGGRIRVGAAAPAQPEGGDLDVTIEALPEQGRILLAGKPVSVGDTLAPADVPALEFDASGLASGTAAVLRYRIDDAWGNSKTALVVVTVTEGATPVPAEAASAADPVAAWVSKALSAPSAVRAGVGPEPLFANIEGMPEEAKSFRLRVDRFPERGELWSSDRRLGAGETIATADLGTVGYAAHSAASSDARIELSLLDGAGRIVRSLSAPLSIALDPCDSLAGEPLDLQGVGPGVAPNEIDVAKAKPACLAAVLAHPQVPRFYYALGRVALAERQTVQGAELIKRAGDMGYVRAHTTYGMLLSRGALGKADPQGANALLEKGAAAGDPFALNELGQRLYFGRDIDEDKKRGLTLLLQSAEMGHTYAINALGAIFEAGNGVKADPARALGFYKVSVARNDIYGFNNLGNFLLEGRAGEPDYAQALELFLKAHKGGHPFAATNIGRMNYLGLGVKKDIPQAVLWYRLAAERGDPYAANNLGYILLHGEAGPPDPSGAAAAYAHAIALDQEGPRADAEFALLEIPEAAQSQAIAQLLADLGYAKKGTEYTGQLPQEALADLTESGFGAPKGVTPTLISLAKLSWLKSKPRFDLF